MVYYWKPIDIRRNHSNEKTIARLLFYFLPSIVFLFQLNLLAGKMLSNSSIFIAVAVVGAQFVFGQNT